MVTSHRLALTAVLALTIAGGWHDNALGREYIFELSDPSGDDHGDGTIRYPFRPDLEPGDLDLVRVAARPASDGTWFEVNFARRIRPPGREAIDAGGTTLDKIARLGFYTFNVDIYIDIDREPGAGQVTLLPGRKAEMRPDHAWERAVVLTPRPNVAEDALEREMFRAFRERNSKEGKRGLTKEQKKQKRDEIEAYVREHIWYARQVRITGNRVDFFVPDSFLGGRARSDWSYFVASSGADLEQRIRIPFLDSVTLDPNSGMIMPVLSVPSERAFGGRDFDPLQPPLVDIVVPSGSDQAELLADYDVVERRPVRLPGVVPATDALGSAAP